MPELEKLYILQFYPGGEWLSVTRMNHPLCTRLEFAEERLLLAREQFNTFRWRIAVYEIHHVIEERENPT